MSERSGAVAVLVWLLCAVPGVDGPAVSQRPMVGLTMGKA